MIIEKFCRITHAKNYPSTADLNKILTLYNDKKYIKAEVLAHQVLKNFQIICFVSKC